MGLVECEVDSFSARYLLEVELLQMRKIYVAVNGFENLAVVKVPKAYKIWNFYADKASSF